MMNVFLKKKNLFCILLFCSLCFAGCSQEKINQAAVLSLEHTFDKGKVNLINGVEPPPGLLKFSPDGKYLIVSSTGESSIRLISSETKKELKEWDVGIGKFRTVVFSGDSKYLYLGENSPDGYLYCIALPSCKKVWQYSLREEMGNDLSAKSYPIVNQVVLDQNDHLYFVGGRVKIRKAGTYDYQFRAYGLQAKTGKMIWKFPAQGMLDISSYVLETDTQGKTVVLNTNTYNNEQKKQCKAGTVYALDGQNGALKWESFFATLPVFKKTRAWVKVTISPDGQYIAVFSRDGRAYLLNQEGKLLWERTLIAPKMVGDALLHASGRMCYFVQDRVIFSTSLTSDLSMGKENLPLEHPNSNTVFAYDLKGNLMWKWKAEGLLNEQRFTRDGKYMLCSVGSNWTTKDISVHAVYLLKMLPKEVRVVEKYQAKSRGMMSLADISPDGKYAAALESPVLLSDGITKVGKYQVHIWPTKLGK